MKNLKKTVAILMAAILFVTAFAGCGKTENPNSEMPEFIYVPTYSKIELPEEVQWLSAAKIIDGRFYAIADTSVEVETVIEETGETVTENRYVQTLVSFDEKGKDFRKEAAFGMDNYYKETENYNEYINDFFMGPKGPAVLVSRNTTVVDLPENFNYETGDYWQYENTQSEFSIHTLNGDGTYDEGTVIANFSNKDENVFYPNYIVTGGDGNLYASSWDKIKVYDTEFKELGEIETGEGGCNGMVVLKDGSVAFLTWEENSGNAIRIIDPKTKKAGEMITVPPSAYSLCSGGGLYDFIYPSPSGSGILGFTIGEEEPEHILSWLDCDVDPNGISSDRIFVKDEETLLTFAEEWGEEETTYNIVSLKKTPSSEIPEKKILTLACTFLDYDVRQKIVEFNRTNPEFRIRAIDYSEYASGEDYSGLTKLNTEIISGNIPDIFATNGMPMTRYAGKGIFEDLVPYIERDIGWENLVEAPFKALMNDEGKLYEIYSNFSISTYAGLKNVVGDGESWTFDDLKEAYAKLPEGATVFEDSATKDYAFFLLVNNQMDSFIDWEKGECYFNTDEFIDILELTATFPTEFDYNDEYYQHYVQPIIRVAKGEQLLCAANIYNLNSFRSRILYILGDQTSLVGLPTNEGSGNSFSFGSGYAMSSSCEYKDAAWEFISSILTEEHQDAGNGYYGSLPTNKKVFDKMVETEMTPEFDEFYDPEQAANPYAEYNPQIGGDIAIDVPVETPAAPETSEDENKIDFVLPEYVKGQVNEKGWHEVPKTYGWIDNGYSSIEFPVYAMTQGELDILMDIIENTTKVARYDNSVNDIINEEIAYFFNGDRTAQQTAEYIQSRVNLYVNEQR